MKTRKTKKGNSIRRIVAFLLCMTMVLGLGMQDVMEQVYAEEGPAAVQQDVQGTENKGNGEQDSASEDPNETPSPTEEGDKAPEDTPAPESETVSETPSDSETPGQPAGDQGSENGTGDGNTGNTGSDENSGNTGNTGNAGNTEQNNNQNTGNTSDGTQGSENGNTGSGNEDKTPAADDAENSDGTKDPNGNGAPAADGVQGVKPTVPGEEDGTGSETADTTEETDETKVPEENVTELTYAAEDGSFSVTATALGEDVDLSGYELHAAQLQKDGEDAERFAAAEELINGALEAENRETEALQVYDVWFTVAETGEETDLSGQVEISIEYTAPEFPEGMDVQMETFCINNGSAEAVEGTDALAAGYELYALAWSTPAGYDETWENEQVIIHVTAEEGVVPEGAELSVTPIVKTEEEELESLPDEEKAKAEDINKKYEETEQKLAEEMQMENPDATENAGVAVMSVANMAEDGIESDTEEAVGQSLEGFLAFDICFLVENGDGEKEEVEPSGEVNVTIEFKEAVAPENVSDEAEVAVKHLKEETDENGEKEIVVEDLTAKETTTVQKAADSAAVEKVELTTDSFSVFLIMWSQINTYGLNVEVRYVYIDAAGNIVDIDPDLVSQENITLEGGKTDQIVNLSQYKKEIDGYSYLKTVKDSANGVTVARLRTVTEERQKWVDDGWFSHWEEYTGYMIHYSSADVGNNFYDWLDSDEEKYGYIYIVYQKENESDITIIDDIIESGALQATYTGEEEKVITSYQWYRCDTYDGTYEEVTEKVYNNNGEILTNISEDGSMLYPALDEGARLWYKVKVTYDDGSTEESVPLRVRYYDKLENGGFENPVVPSSTNDEGEVEYQANLQYGNSEYENLGGVWKSTGEIIDTYHGKKVALEILNEMGNGAGDYSWINDNDWGIEEGATEDSGAAPEGKQFAELNAQAAGALYQDVLTLEGRPLNYSLMHRARGDNKTNIEGEGWFADKIDEYDTMYLIIMPTKEAIDNVLTTQDNLEDYLLNGLEGTSININQPYEERVENGIVYNNTDDGILIVRVTSNDEAWQTVRGFNYIPTASATRFFFVAGATASGSNTVGNFLDNVYFGQDMPPVADDEFTLEIQKKFEGLDQTGINRVKDSIQFKITATKNGQEVSEEKIAELLGRDLNVISGSEMRMSPDGTLSIPIANKSIGLSDEYVITVTEIGAELDGYKMTSSAEADISVDDVESDPVSGTNSVTFILKAKTIATAVFTNEYDSSESKTVSFTKVWDDGNNVFETRPNSLNVTLKAAIEVGDDQGNLTVIELDGTRLGGVDMTKSLTGDDWSTSWEVPVYYDYNSVKVKINYSVVESEVNSDYVYEAAFDEVQVGDGSEYQGTFAPEKVTKADNTASVTNAGDILNTTALRAGVLNASRAGGSDGTDELGTPNHNKYVTYNRNTGDYTLNLDVTGAQGDASGVDILFVIDTSGSMGGYYSRLLSNVKDLLTDQGGIVDQIFAAEGNVNSVAYVSFAGKGETYASGWYQKSNSASLKHSINGLYANGGTNWTYAMQRASSVLAQRADSGNEKVVIFLSDGEPTYSMSGNWQTGSGSSTRNSYYNDAANVVKDSGSLKSAKFYSVYLTSETQRGMSRFNNLLRESNVDAELKNGTDLSKALTDILKTIIPTYKNVVITDTLSEYVDFVDGEITVTAESADGSKRELSEGEYEATISNKTVTVELLKGESLTAGTTYTVSFRVKPNETADNYYATNNNYPDIGDAGTGTTSAGQKGFNSNKEGTAKVTYTVNDEGGSADYPMPVVQVTTHSLTFHKEWNKPDGVNVTENSVSIKVTYTDGTSDEITLDENKEWTDTITVPVTKSIARVEELTQIEDYTPSYQISEDRTSATVINNYSKIEKQDITVKKKWIGGTESPIEVVLLQSVDGADAVVRDTEILSEDNNWSHTWENVDLEKFEGSQGVTYTYAVREVNTPAGFSSSIKYSYGNDGIEAVITNTYDPNCADEQYYMANVLQTEELTVSKTWDDNNNELNLRPSKLPVTVDDGNGGFYNLNLNASGSWQETLTILKKAERTFTATEAINSQYYQQDGAAAVTETPNGVAISFVNKITSKDIVVKKEWNDGGAETLRPGSISFELQYRESKTDNWKPYHSGLNENGTYTLTEESIIYDTAGEQTSWAMKISGLPAGYEYQVVEITTEGTEPYTSAVTESSDGSTFTITNTLKWELKKTNMPGDGTEEKALAGGSFGLYGENDDKIATGTSGDDGFVTWEVAENTNLYDLNGTYTLIEETAPAGYQKLQGKWTLTFKDGLLTNVSGADEDYNIYISKSNLDGKGVVITLKNDELYDLPSTGGPGVYLYMLGGTMLMMAGALLVYKKRKEEVLRS